MITFQPLIPSAPTLSALDQLITMMAFLGDAEACKARLAELRQAAEESAAIVAHADELRAEIAAERAALAAEREQQAKQIEAERADFERRCAARDQEINARSKDVDKLQAAAKADREAAARLKADLERRVKQVQQAVA